MKFSSSTRDPVAQGPAINLGLKEDLVVSKYRFTIRSCEVFDSLIDLLSGCILLVDCSFLSACIWCVVWEGL